jgi:hypothetical protein
MCFFADILLLLLLPNCLNKNMHKKKTKTKTKTKLKYLLIDISLFPLKEYDNTETCF